MGVVEGRMVVGMLVGMPGPADAADGGPRDAAEAVRNAHEWFEANSGWAPPDDDTLAEWVADGVCRCPDECLVAPDAWCGHGLASWALILAALAEADAAARRPASSRPITRVPVRPPAERTSRPAAP